MLNPQIDQRLGDDDDVFDEDMSPISPTSTLVSLYDDRKLDPFTPENLARGSSRGGCWYVMSALLLDTLSHLDLTGHVACVARWARSCLRFCFDADVYASECGEM